MKTTQGFMVAVSVLAGGFAGIGAAALKGGPDAAEVEELRGSLAELRAEIQSQRTALTGVVQALRAQERLLGERNRVDATGPSGLPTRTSSGPGSPSRPGDPSGNAGAGGTGGAPAAAQAGAAPIQDAIQEELRKRDERRRKQMSNYVSSMMQDETDEQLKRLSSRLALSEYQKGEMRKLLEEYQQKAVEVMLPLFGGGMDSEEAPSEAPKRLMKKLEEEYQQRVRAFLSPQQYEEFLKIEKGEEAEGQTPQR